MAKGSRGVGGWAFIIGVIITALVVPATVIVALKSIYTLAKD